MAFELADSCEEVDAALDVERCGRLIAAHANGAVAVVEQGAFDGLGAIAQGGREEFRLAAAEPADFAANEPAQAALGVFALAAPFLATVRAAGRFVR